MKGIFVWHQGAVGDLVLSLPAVYSIKKHFNGHAVHLIARSDFSDIVVAGGIADVVSSNERGLYAEFFSESAMSKAAANFLENFESAFVFMRRKNGTFMNNLRRHVRSCCQVCTVPPDGMREHVTAYQLEQLEKNGIGAAMLSQLAAGAEGTDGTDGEDEPVVSIHPGSGGKEKCWHLQGFLALLEALAEEERYRFIILLGPAEADMENMCRRFIADRDMRAEIVIGKPLSAVVPILKASSIYVGNDSGITHLASMLGVPTLAIFGPTDPAIWRPLGRNVRVIRPARYGPIRSSFSGSPPENAEVEDVAVAAKQLLFLRSPAAREDLPYIKHGSLSKPGGAAAAKT